MSSEEIVKRLRTFARHCDGVHACWNDVTLKAAADLIESLTAQLTEAREREWAAIEDIYFINGNDDGVCSICQSKDECTLCLDGTCSFAWRGPREEEKK